MLVVVIGMRSVSGELDAHNTRFSRLASPLTDQSGSRRLTFLADFSSSGEKQKEDDAGMKIYYLFILSSRHHRHLSVGVTADLASGVRAHRALINRRLGKRHVLQKLVYVETIQNIDEAVEREVRLKRATRQQLHALVETVNPGWDRLSLRELVSVGFSR